MTPLLNVTDLGLYCEAGDFYIDPWRAVPKALITHAHSDHARSGSAAYLCADPCVGLLRGRLGAAVPVTGIPYGKRQTLGDVTVSFHPAGHVLGSAQIRVERAGEVWVVSGDYKRQADPTCAAFELVPCHTFVTECTFGLPIYRWPESAAVFAQIHEWWRHNQAEGRTSVIFAYSLGKSQRLLAGLDPAQGPIFVHSAVAQLLPCYEAEGIPLPEVQPLTKEAVKAAKGQGLIISPPALEGTPLMKSLGPVSTAFASGWMLIRGARRWRSADRGFVLSDHVDWPALIQTIRETGATRILPTHGSTGPLVRWLRENGWEAEPLKTHFTGDDAEASDAT
jgi:putative mRNA 3-end processing factor